MNRLTVIVVLAIALCASIGLNVSQFLHHFRAEIEAPLVAQVEAYAVADTLNAAVAKARARDLATIARLQGELATRQVETVTVYRDRVRTLPAPSCAPGADRVAAWNTLALEAP